MIGDRVRQVRFNLRDGVNYAVTLVETMAFGVFDARLTRNGREVGVWRGFQPGSSMSYDGDAAMASVLHFVCLRPGDVEPDYFADYTPKMVAFRDGDAEALGIAVFDRFGDL